MAECSYARCMQERRTIKKHLQKWTKACIYTLGFERVAEEFMGRRKWRIYQEQVLKSWFPSIEREIQIKDWEPSDDKCTFCDLLPPGGKLPDEELKNSLGPDSLSHHHNNNNIDPLSLEGDDSNSNSTSSIGEDSSSMMNALDSVTSLAAIAALAGPGGAPNPLNPLSMYPPGMFPRWYLSPPPRALLEGMKPDAPMVMNLPATSGPEMPLDLSAKGSKQSTEVPENLRIPNLTESSKLYKDDRTDEDRLAASLYRAKPRMSPMHGRRSYTEEELQAALRDIQSGKLGTRRAAVIYGIPRSTLRNKVYKLALERERDAHLLLAPLPRPSPPDPASSSPTVPVMPDKEDSSAEEDKESSTKPPFSIEDLLRLSALETNSQTEGINLLLQNIRKLQTEGFSLHDIFSGLGLEHSALGQYLAHLLRLKEASSSLDRETENDKKEIKDKELDDKDDEDKGKERYPSPIVPDLMRRMIAEERLLIEEKLKNKLSNENLNQNGVDDDPSNVILKIPSFKPNAASSKDSEARFSNSPAGESSHSAVSPTLNGGNDSPPLSKFNLGISSLRDVIAKSISQKFQDGIGPTLLGHDIDGLTKRNFQHLNLPNPHSVMKNHYDRGQQRIPQPNNNSNVSNSQSTKGTRPKRGKYRNYDRDSLVEAVRAVQRGEMSVHRAGSYYGVPHSTLEYKVKERHLMRPRKREPKDDKNKMSSQSSTSGSTPPAADKKVIPPVPKPSGTKPAFPATPTLPNGLKIPPGIFDTPIAYPGAPFPFWPPSHFHPMSVDPRTAGFPTTPPELFNPQMIRNKLEAPPSPSSLPPTARKIAESLYDGSGNNGSFLDGIIRSSLEMGVPQKNQNRTEVLEKTTPEKMSNKSLLDQLCRNSRLTPLPKPESNSDEDGNVPYDYSDDEEDKNSREKRSFNERDRKSLDRDDRGEKKANGIRAQDGKDRSNRSSISDDNDKIHSPGSKHSTDDDNMDEDIDDISNHASDEDEPMRNSA